MSLDKRTGFIQVQGGQLYYEAAGEGPAVVLIHAGVADVRMWRYQFPDFAQSHTVIAYDTRGFGRSTTQSVPFSNRQDLIAVLDHFQVSRAAVMGVSRGGQIAIDFSVEFPQRVAALLPVAAGLSGYEHTFASTPRDEMERTTFEQMEKLWEQKDFTQFSELGVQVWGDGIGQPAGRMPAEPRNLLSQMTYANNTRQDGEPTPQPLQPPAAERLGEIHCPTLILHGDLDVSAMGIIASRLEQGIAGARRILYPGVAHMLSMEIPERFNQDVLAFLESIKW